MQALGIIRPGLERYAFPATATTVVVVDSSKIEVTRGGYLVHVEEGLSSAQVVEALDALHVARFAPVFAHLHPVLAGVQSNLPSNRASYALGFACADAQVAHAMGEDDRRDNALRLVLESAQYGFYPSRIEAFQKALALAWSVGLLRLREGSS